MAFQKDTGRPPLAGRITTATADQVRKMYLAGARMAEIGAAIGEGEIEVYRFVEPRRQRWLRENDFEQRAVQRGHIVLWRNCSRKNGGCDIRPITLPGTTMQRNMLAEANR